MAAPEGLRVYSAGPEPDVILNRQVFERAGAAAAALSLSELDPAFTNLLTQLLANCSARGIEMVPYTGIRDPWEQARLWRQSRTSAVVQAAIQNLTNAGADFLVQVMNDVGAQPSGPRVTGALPGFSWHQWGKAVDSYWRVGGTAEWDDLTGYKVYAEEATNLGLTAGGFWTSIEDWPHVQLPNEDGPADVFTTKQIDTAMRERFGGSPPSG